MTTQPSLGQPPAYVVVTVDLSGARFWRCCSGELTELSQNTFAANTTQWKRKEYSKAVGRASRLPHGAQRDVFNQRMQAQVEHFLRNVAKQIIELGAHENSAAIFLVGADRLVNTILSNLPDEFRARVGVISQDLAGLSGPELQLHLALRIAEWEREQENKIVNALLEDHRAAILGLDETLAQLQAGRIRILVVTRGLTGDLRKCVNCGLANRSADPVCPACGGQRTSVPLVQVLSELIRTHDVVVHEITGEAANRLTAAGGMGGWLRQKAKRAHS